jgi:DNA-binding Lrp family transcriptional regulator
MSGSSDYLIHIVAEDLPDFERLHANVLGHLPGVSRIESKFALRTAIDRPLVPIG